MHGIIFNQFFKFVRETQGEDILTEIKKKAGYELKFYDATQSHPDDELVAMLDAASQILNVAKDFLLEEFGKFIVPDLIKVYSIYIKKEWRFIDLMSEVENTMHKVIRRTDPEADPPQLKIKRYNNNEILIEYSSPRKMVALGIGIIKKIAEYYSEEISIEKSDLIDGVSLLKVSVLKPAY